MISANLGPEWTAYSSGALSSVSLEVVSWDRHQLSKGEIYTIIVVADI